MLSHAGELLRAPWMGEGWDGKALLFVLAILAGSLGLTAWRLHTEAEG